MSGKTIQPITSPSNPKVKLWASLLEKKGRDKSGLFLVEGPHLVAEAFRSGAPIECVVCQQGRPLAGDVQPFAAAAEPSGGVPWYEVPAEVMAKCVDTVQHQGIFAVIRKFRRSLDGVLEAPNALVLAADRVQDPGNVGTMIRSADAAGATAVILGKGCVDLYNPKTIRSTMGSLFHLPVLEWDLQDAVRQAAARGIQIVSTELDAPHSFYDIDYTRGTWIIMGNEAHGVSEELMKRVNKRVQIPMKGGAESLNVAMASTIMLYEAFRQRYVR